jgi:hypothetical protein
MERQDFPSPQANIEIDGSVDSKRNGEENRKADLSHRIRRIRRKIGGQIKALSSEQQSSTNTLSIIGFPILGMLSETCQNTTPGNRKNVEESSEINPPALCSGVNSFINTRGIFLAGEWASPRLIGNEDHCVVAGKAFT